MRETCRRKGREKGGRGCDCDKERRPSNVPGDQSPVPNCRTDRGLQKRPSRGQAVVIARNPVRKSYYEGSIDTGSNVKRTRALRGIEDARERRDKYEGTRSWGLELGFITRKIGDNLGGATHKPGKMESVEMVQNERHRSQIPRGGRPK